LERIVGLLLKSVEKLLEERQITLELTPAAKELLLREGYDPAYGARPLRRTIQRLIQDPWRCRFCKARCCPAITSAWTATAERRNEVCPRPSKQPAAAAGI